MPQTRSRGLRSLSNQSITPSKIVVLEEMQEVEAAPRGVRQIGLHPKGGPGRNAENIMQSTLSMSATLSATRDRKQGDGRITRKRMITATNTVWNLLLSKVGEQAAEPMSDSTFRRNFKMNEGDKVPVFILGYPFKYVNGNDETQMAIFNKHVDAIGYPDLIRWGGSLIVAELRRTGAAEALINTRQLSEMEKRVLRVDIVGIQALDEKVDEDIELEIPDTVVPAGQHEEALPAAVGSHTLEPENEDVEEQPVPMDVDPASGPPAASPVPSVPTADAEWQDLNDTSTLSELAEEIYGPPDPSFICRLSKQEQIIQKSMR